ncbi:hypothetical protein IAR50_000188 [Cryptococcus sp. DSM 104548]
MLPATRPPPPSGAYAHSCFASCPVTVQQAPGVAWPPGWSLGSVTMTIFDTFADDHLSSAITLPHSSVFILPTSAFNAIF